MYISSQSTVVVLLIWQQDKELQKQNVFSWNSWNIEIFLFSPGTPQQLHRSCTRALDNLNITEMDAQKELALFPCILYA